MAEHGADEGVWDPGSDHYGPVELEPLGVSAGLVQRLKDWNGEFQALALTEDFEFASEEEELEWIRRGLHLAYELQNELPDIAVSYAHDNDDRPVRERRGA